MENVKQKAREMFDECPIKIEWEEKPEIADILQKMSNIAFEKQKKAVYPILDQIIDLAIKERDGEIVEMIEKNKKQTKGMAQYGMGYDDAMCDFINLITNSKE